MTGPTILIANDEEKDKEIAKLKAQNEEYEKKAKAMDEEHEKMEAKLNAQVKEIPATPGPVVKAIISAMDEDDMEKAKKAIKAAMDEEHDEAKKAAMEEDLKAMEQVFNTGNGVNTNAMRHGQEDDEEKEKTAVIAALTAKVAKPIINEILTAKTNAGATEDQIKEETKRLTAMTLPQVEAEYKTQEIFIKQALAATAIEEDTEALSASFEKTFEFNGVNGLTAKVIDVDEILEQITQ